MSGPPVVVLGPTAAGKSDVAMAAACTVAGTEIVAVDAMQVYGGMDIGTAKPTPAERALVAHHCLDLVAPSVDFTVIDYRAAYDAAVAGIAGRPLLVAGTGLYLAAVIDHLDPPGQWNAVRYELDADPDVAGMWRRLATLDPVAASRIEPANRRRVVRALEVTLGSGRPFSSYGPGLQAYPPTEATLVGIRWPRAALAARIERRVAAMMAAGLLAEVEQLAAARMSRTARQALGYKELLAHLGGSLSLDEAVATIVRRTRQFAVRQERWFRRDPRVRWYDVQSDPVAEVAPVVVRGAQRMTGLTLTKHHGLGNDFLAVLDPPDTDLAALARRMCDRRAGVGADGLLVAEPAAGYAARMVLFNADGSRAEMSGNGIRCLAQALAARRGDLAVQTILTDAGPRRVELRPTEDPLTILATVDLGAVRDRSAPDAWAAVGTHPDRPVAHLDLGNPHTVVGVDDVVAVDLVALGRRVPDVNLEIIEPGPEPNTVTMRVHERGAGITQACGTGAAAAGWAAARWGFVDAGAAELVVHMDGGSARVALHRPEPGHVTLTGPVTFVATIHIP